MRWLTLMAAILVSVLFLPLQAANASCAADSGPEGAPVIFVGTAEAERRGYTRFAVEEVRAGPDLAPEVWVLSGQEQTAWPLSLFLAVESSTDAAFAIGDRYVVGASRSFATDACRVASVDAGVTDSGVRGPVDDGAAGADPPLGPVGRTIWVAAIVGLVTAAVGLLRRVRRPAPGASVTSAE